jgi:hypothetical protein
MPVDITYDGARVHIVFATTITGADLSSVMQFLIDLESRVIPNPNRLIDLGPSTTLAIGFADIANVAQVRRANSPANPIRTAVVAHSATQQGYARMFQTLNDHPLISVAVFSDRVAAEAWLSEG